MVVSNAMTSRDGLGHQMIFVEINSTWENVLKINP